MSLTENQRERYERNILVPGFGEPGQEHLAKARVLIVGMGGLGSPAAYYLAAAGVGVLGLIDSDCVSLSNLQRQILHSMAWLNKPKTESAAHVLAQLNPDVRTERFDERLTPENAPDRIRRFDVVIEACDNFEAKFLINDVCLDQKKPFATAGILAMSGQALFVVPGRTCCLRCAVPTIPKGIPTTAEEGVLGPVPGILGSVEALEVIRWLTGFWKAQPDGAGLLHTVAGAQMRVHTLRVPRRPDCRCARLGIKDER
jgi:molybdopterin/thiamine biosynthesis adenylyltransferase